MLTGAVAWTITGGVPRALAANSGGAATFVQISDSHVGFHLEANPDPVATLREAVTMAAALKPAFVLHTGDVTHLSKPAEFDMAGAALQTLGDVRYVPGEHDVIGDDGKEFFARLGHKDNAGGWYSFDHQGVHFVGLINVLGLQAGGLGRLGPEQLEWVKRDLASKSPSTPLVIFAHMPLWTVYQSWGWGTEDGDQLFALVKRFGSVTVLNGHIHQSIQKVEGNVVMATAMSTAFPQPAPGAAPSPGPMKVPAERLRAVLGVRRVDVISEHPSAIADKTLVSA
jgi:3',5'-cyclic AMP phosphodiesterase CpdA